MKTIYKYPVEITDEQKISMPKDARILTIQYQKGTYLPCIWALVDTEKPLKDRLIRIFGTGNPAYYKHNLDYIGTVQEDVFVWHVFEEYK